MSLETKVQQFYSAICEHVSFEYVNMFTGLPIENLLVLGYGLFSVKQQYDLPKWWTATQSNLGY